MKEKCWTIKEERPIPVSITIGNMSDKRVTIEVDPMLMTYETFETLRMDFRREDGTIHDGATFATYDYENGEALLKIADVIEWLRHHEGIVS